MPEDIEKKLSFDSSERSDIDKSEALVPSQKIEKFEKELPESTVGFTPETKNKDLVKPEVSKKDTVLTEKSLENSTTPDQVRAALASGDAEKLEELAKDPSRLLDKILDFQDERED